MAVLSSILGIGIGILGISRVAKKRYMVIRCYNELGNKESIYKGLVTCINKRGGLLQWIKGINRIRKQEKEL